KRKANCVAVCFFNDPTYYWEQPHRLKPLNNKIIAEFLKNGYKTTTNGDLVIAYEEAKGYSSLHDFITNRFEQEDRLDELEIEELKKNTIAQGEDPFEGKLKEPRKQVKNNTPASSPNVPSTVVVTATVATSVPVIPPTAVEKRKLKTPEKNSKSQPAKKKSKLDHARRIEICMLFRRKIQRNLVQRDNPPTDEEILETHQLLRKIEENLDSDPAFFDLNSLRESKLHKLLKVILNDDNLSEFHQNCKKILMSWANLITDLKLEKENKPKE
ncbi:hypothetical protein Kpol_1050p104, partial [Vanderwaltozyma polyspora DSM 70294]